MTLRVKSLVIFPLIWGWILLPGTHALSNVSLCQLATWCGAGKLSFSLRHLRCPQGPSCTGMGQWETPGSWRGSTIAKDEGVQLHSTGATEKGEAWPERNMKFYDLKINASNKYLLIFTSWWQELGYFSSTTSLPLILFTASSVNFYRWIFYRRCLQARGRWLPVGTCWFCLFYFSLFLLFDTLKILPWETFPLFFTNHPTVLLAVLSNFGNGAIQSFQETGPWALVPKRTLRRLPWVIFPHWKSGFGGVSIWFKVTSKLPACWERNGSSDSFFI